MSAMVNVVWASLQTKVHNTCRLDTILVISRSEYMLTIHYRLLEISPEIIPYIKTIGKSKEPST